VMLALRRIVYDNDFQAKDMTEYRRWDPAKGSSWKANKSFTSFSRDAEKTEKVDWLRYKHLVRPKEGPLAGKLEPQLITDIMDYNSVWLDNWEQTPPQNWVGDLMLECRVDVRKSEGEFWLELSKGIHRFQARWDLSSGVCTLFKNEFKQVNGSGELKRMPPVELDSKPTKLRGPGSYQVRFANIDARLTVWVDRELPFGDGKDYPPPEVKNGAEEKDLDEIELQKRRGPTENDLQPASIGADGASLEVSQVRLWRDTYYTVAANQSDVGVDLTNRGNWHQFRTMPFKTLYVQPGHYLCLGDNSQASSDGRDWGLVPDRLMLGRALLVYYPFNRAGPIR
jgi:Signal peptidase, peptidase S26